MKKEIKDSNLGVRGLIPEIIIAVSAVGFFGTMFGVCNTDVNQERIQNEIILRKNQFDEYISDQVKLEGFNATSIKCYKDIDENYKLKIFGDLRELTKNGYESKMKNIEYAISPSQYHDYKESLRKFVDFKYLKNINGSAYSISFKQKPTWRKEANNYKDNLSCFFDSIEDVATTSNYTISDCGSSVAMQSILKNNYQENIMYLIDLSSPYNYEDNNYVYVHTLQTDDSRNWYNIEGRFKVQGENLSSEEVYQKIYDGEYEFFKGDTQNTKSQNIAENNLELVY